MQGSGQTPINITSEKAHNKTKMVKRVKSQKFFELDIGIIGGRETCD